ncbi:MAG: hypothetical protein DMG49_00005, partial [Acidobacteria bacterium]
MPICSESISGRTCHAARSTTKSGTRSKLLSELRRQRHRNSRIDIGSLAGGARRGQELRRAQCAREHLVEHCSVLRLVAGFEEPTAGEIWMSGQRLDVLPPYKRRVNTVFQHYALFPHLTVRENVAYGLRVKKTSRAQIGGRVDEALRTVKMQEFADSRPSKLSGGQQQRVALARALINRPLLLLLDEPLSALDANLRKQMQSELKALQREIGITFLFVTHDQEEAMVLSDRIALLRDGALEQVASPREIYAHPATAYTAQFI